MAGETCGDFGAASVKITEGQQPLCVMPQGHFLAGLVTTSEGVVPNLDDSHQGDGTFVASDDKTKLKVDFKLTKEMKGAEIGNCNARGMGSGISYAFLQTTYKGTPVSWSASDLKEVYRIIGQTKGQTDNAFICEDLKNQGKIAINNDVAHQPSLKAAIETLQKDHGALDDIHYHALLSSLYAATGQQEPKETSFWNKVHEYWPLAILFGIQGPVQIYSLVQFLRKFFTKDPPDGPSDKGSGSGGGSGAKFSPTLKALAHANPTQTIPNATTSDMTIAPPKTVVGGSSVGTGGVIVPGQVGAPAPVVIPEPVVVP